MKPSPAYFSQQLGGRAEHLVEPLQLHLVQHLLLPQNLEPRLRRGRPPRALPTRDPGLHHLQALQEPQLGLRGQQLLLLLVGDQPGLEVEHLVEEEGVGQEEADEKDDDDLEEEAGGDGDETRGRVGEVVLGGEARAAGRSVCDLVVILVVRKRKVKQKYSLFIDTSCMYSRKTQ